MALISLRQLLDHAAENNYGVPAFNVNNLEAIRAIMEGAKELNSPVILQASGAARKYAGPVFVKKLVEAAMEEFSEIPTVGEHLGKFWVSGFRNFQIMST